MNVIVQSHDVKVTKALKKFVTDQAQKLNRLLPSSTQINVFLEKVSRKKSDPSSNKVKYSIELPGKRMVVVKKTAVDMYHAVVDATDTTFRHLRKAKEKVLTKRRGH